MTSTQAFNELKRIFGDDAVTKEFCAPANLLGGATKERWCYVVTLSADHPLVPASVTRNNFDMRNAGGRLETFLTNRLDIDLNPLDNSIRTKAQEWVGQAPEPLRFVITTADLETIENVNELKNISRDAVHNSLLERDIHNHDMHIKTLRHATHGLKWIFVSNGEGEFYETTRPVRTPEGLEMGILSRLQLGDDQHFIAAASDGKARITREAMMSGRLGSLMESILPKAVCEPVKRSRETSRS